MTSQPVLTDRARAFRSKNAGALAEREQIPLAETKTGVIYEVTLTVKRSGSRASRGDAWMRSVW